MAIKFSEAVIPVTDLKIQSKKIIQKLHSSGKPILITQRGRGTAVMESLETYEKRQEYYEQIAGILTALRQADEGKLHHHREALKILESF